LYVGKDGKTEEREKSCCSSQIGQVHQVGVQVEPPSAVIAKPWPAATPDLEATCGG